MTRCVLNVLLCFFFEPLKKVLTLLFVLEGDLVTCAILRMSVVFAHFIGTVHSSVQEVCWSFCFPCAPPDCLLPSAFFLKVILAFAYSVSSSGDCGSILTGLRVLNGVSSCLCLFLKPQWGKPVSKERISHWILGVISQAHTISGLKPPAGLYIHSAMVLEVSFCSRVVCLAGSHLTPFVSFYGLDVIASTFSQLGQLLSGPGLSLVKAPLGKFSPSYAHLVIREFFSFLERDMKGVL